LFLAKDIPVPPNCNARKKIGVVDKGWAKNKQLLEKGMGVVCLAGEGGGGYMQLATA